MKQNNFLNKAEFSLNILLPESLLDKAILATIALSVVNTFFSPSIEAVIMTSLLFTNYVSLRFGYFTRKGWGEALERERDHMEFLENLAKIIEQSPKKKKGKK